jgi:hypothetical protein
MIYYADLLQIPILFYENKLDFWPCFYSKVKFWSLMFIISLPVLLIKYTDFNFS